MNKDFIKVGVIGCGVVGGTLIKWLEKHNKKCEILRVDPPKGFNDDISQADIIFISIHIPTEKDGTQDLMLLESIIKDCPNVPIYIRTTLLPGTCDKLSKKLNKEVNFMPEFLIERLAEEDIEVQPVVFTANVDLLRNVFVGKKYVVMNSTEAEIAKYAHNVFGALKVTYFNGIYELCQKHGADFNKVREGVSVSGRVGDYYSEVPGPDGKFGYGGKCFPKDVEAFIHATEDCNFNKLLNVLPSINEFYRKPSVKELK